MPRFPLPFGGLNDNEAFGDQPAETTREMVNMRTVDPVTGRKRISQRSGLSKYNASQVSGTNPIKHLATVGYDQTKVTYTSLGSSVTTEQNITTPSTSEVKGVVVDRQGNVYVIDGKASIVKYNSAGTKLWTLSLPVDDPNHECRALAVDDAGNVFAAISTGGVQSKARMWCYEQLAENKTKQVWQLDLGVYVERIVLKDDRLYTAQNDVDSQQSYIVGYTGADRANPEEVFRRRASYPLNDLAASPKDGSLFYAAQPNATRGVTPKSPDTTEVAVDYDPVTNLSSYSTRIWAHLDATEEDTLVITPLTNADTLEGGTVEAWLDKSGKGRHLYADAKGGATPHTGPTYRLKGPGGRPCLHFNGTSNSMKSVTPTTTDKSARDEILSLIPTYAGAQFVVFMVVRLAADATMRWILFQDNGSSDRMLIANRTQGSTLPGTASQGEITLHELSGTASDSTASTVAAVAPLGANTMPLGGPVGWNNCAVITWVCDGRVHDQFGTATRSMLRINGQPCARWQSASFSSAVETMLGYGTNPSSGFSPFAGDICEIMVLADWYDSSNAQQRLITTQDYPDESFAYSTATSYEMDEIEGYLAGKYGLMDQLTAGPAAWLLANGTQPSNNDTVTINDGSGAVTYTFKSALTATPTAREVFIGATVRATLQNLKDCINNTGQAGVQYGGSSTPHSEYRACAPVAYNSTPHYAMRIQAINSRGSTRTLAEGITPPWSWSTSATGAVATSTSFSPSTANANIGWFPHLYNRYKLASQTHGGPPRSDTSYSTPSKEGLAANSKYGILAKIDTANAKLKWVATSLYNGSSSDTVGGVGWGVIINSQGDVYSVGPRQATDTYVLSADTTDVRKIIDNGSSFSLLAGTTATTGWNETLGSALTYAYPRLAVDKFDNLYVPIYQGSTGTSLIVYKRYDASSVVIATVQGITDDPRGYAVAVDPAIPEYPSSFTNTRAEFVWLGSEVTGSSSYGLYKLKLVSTASATGTPRDVKFVAVSNGNIRTFTTSAISTPSGSPTLDSSSQFISSAVIYRKLYLSDGLSYKVYDPKTDTVSAHTASSAGTIPPRCKLMCSWRNRLVLARDPDNPSNYFMSAVGDPANWDFFPHDSPIPTQALKGVNAVPGRPSDLINTLIPYSDDLLIIGGERSIRRFTGDPAAGGQIDLISDTYGTGFGPCWAKAPDGTLYVYMSRGGVLRMAPNSIPVPITDGVIERRFRAIDLSTYYMLLVWDIREFGLRVYQIPYAGHSGSTAVKMWFWSQKTNAWMEDEFGKSGSIDTRPTFACNLDGDGESARVMVQGSQDGYIRLVSESAKTDDTVPIDARVVLGPFVGEAAEYESKVTSMDALLSLSQDGCIYQAYMSDYPDALGGIVRHGELVPGRNKVPLRMSGSALWVRLRNVSQNVGDSGTRFAIESVHFDIHRGGRKRGLSR